MKISTRISLIFSLVSSLLLIGFGVTIYLFDSYHQELDFQTRLQKRVAITENFFLEKDAFSPIEFEKIRTQFTHILPSETEEVIEVKPGIPPAFKHSYAPALKTEILQNETYSFREGDVQGESRFFEVKGKKFLIIVTAIDEIGNQNLSFLISRIVILSLIAIPVIFLISFWISKRSLQPISRKIEHANRISASNLGERLQVIHPNDELGQFATAFNKLLDRLEVTFVAQKSFIANASHEIRNPLTAIMGEAEIALSKTRTPEAYIESLTVILEEAESMNATVNNLLQLSKVTGNETDVQYSAIDLATFLEEVKTSFDYSHPDHQIVLNIEEPKAMILGNRNLLKNVITNLWDNACKYSKNEVVQVNLFQEEQFYMLVVSDQGIGIPASELKEVMAPFYRAKNTFNFKGSGVGLALSQKIIQLHQAVLCIDSKEGIGTDVVVKFPAI